MLAAATSVARRCALRAERAPCRTMFESRRRLPSGATSSRRPSIAWKCSSAPFHLVTFSSDAICSAAAASSMTDTSVMRISISISTTPSTCLSSSSRPASSSSVFVDFLPRSSSISSSFSRTSLGVHSTVAPPSSASSISRMPPRFVLRVTTDEKPSSSSDASSPAAAASAARRAASAAAFLAESLVAAGLASSSESPSTRSASSIASKSESSSSSASTGTAPVTAPDSAYSAHWSAHSFLSWRAACMSDASALPTLFDSFLRSTPFTALASSVMAAARMASPACGMPWLTNTACERL